MDKKHYYKIKVTCTKVESKQENVNGEFIWYISSNLITQFSVSLNEA